MSSPYVCPSCRRNVLRHAISLRRLPRASKATFISFTSNKPRKTSEKETPAASPDADKNSSPSAHESQPERQPLGSPLAQPSTRARPSNPSRADALSSLFNVLDIPSARGKYSGTTFAEQNAHELPPAPQRNRLPASKSQIPQNKPVATELDRILSGNERATAAAWEHFQTHYTSPDCEALKSPSLLDIRHTVEGNVFRKLLKALFKDWSAGRFEGALPEPVQAVEKFVYLGIMRIELWQEILWFLNMNAFKKLNGTAGEQHKRSLAEMISQLMMAWDNFFKQYATSASSPLQSRPSGEAESPPAMWSSLPNPAAAHQASRQHKFFGARLNVILPDVLPPAKINKISYSALVTFDILNRDETESALDQGILTDFRPFVVFLAHMIAGTQSLPGSRVTHPPHAMQSLLEQSQISQEEVVALFNRIKEFQGKSRNIIGAYGSFHDGDGETRSPEESFDEYYFKRAARCYHRGKPQMVQRVWFEACQTMSQQDGYKISPRLYNLILEALMALGQPEQAIQVWNKMIENGTHPTIKTWTAMLTGCGKAKDIHGLEQMWVRMLSSGIQPDAHAWSSRISGIMSAGKTEHGLRVLEEMGKIWLEAYKRVQSGGKKKGSQVDEANLPARPSTIILNGAITALSQMPPRHHRYIARVLAWSRSFGIEPDVFTFNALISMSLKNGNAPEAMKLLQQMELVKVQPDIATFAIILNSIFRSSNTAAMSQEEQNDKIMSVLQDLEARGIEANAHVYSTLIDGLLKRHGNEQAARAVLNHMAAKKIEISPHIYTILMTYYFQHEDFESVEALWTRIQASGTVVDVVFYDRMIERYAAIGDTGKMTTFLTQMSKEGLTPGWPALQAVVVKLADIGDWERFDEIVRDVENKVGLARKGLRKSDENVIHRFWKAVEYKKRQRPLSEAEKLTGLS